MILYEKLENRARLIKFILCSVLGLALGKIIGYPGTSTIAVSSILMLYIDRGFTGSLRYSWRRIQAQVFIGGIVYAVIWVLRVSSPLPDWIIGILAAVTAIAIGLPLQHRKPFAPLTVTVGNAALIMAAGTLANGHFYQERVLFCVLGAVIAHVVNFLVMPQTDRYGAVCLQLREDSVRLLCRVAVYEFPSRPPASETRADATGKLLGLLREDKRWKHQKLADWKYELAAGLLAVQRQLLRLEEEIDRWGDGAGPQFRSEYLEHLEKGAALHRRLLDDLSSVAAPASFVPFVLPILPAGGPEEVFIASGLLHYLESLNRMAELGDAEARDVPLRASASADVQ